MGHQLCSSTGWWWFWEAACVLKWAVGKWPLVLVQQDFEDRAGTMRFKSCRRDSAVLALCTPLSHAPSTSWNPDSSKHSTHVCNVAGQSQTFYVSDLSKNKTTLCEPHYSFIIIIINSYVLHLIVAWADANYFQTAILTRKFMLYFINAIGSDFPSFLKMKQFSFQVYITEVKET